MDFGLRLIHPFMPFLSEELYQRLPRRINDSPSIMISPYPVLNPQNQQWINLEIEEEVKIAQEIVHGVRSVRSKYNILTRLPLFIRTISSQIQILQNYIELINTLSFSSETKFLDSDFEAGPHKCLVNVVNDKCQVYLAQGNFNIEAEIEKLEKKSSILRDQIDALNKKIASQTKAPDSIKQSNAERLCSFQQEFKTTEEAILAFKEML